MSLSKNKQAAIFSLFKKFEAVDESKGADTISISFDGRDDLDVVFCDYGTKSATMDVGYEDDDTVVKFPGKNSPFDVLK